MKNNCKCEFDAAPILGIKVHFKGILSNYTDLPTNWNPSDAFLVMNNYVPRVDQAGTFNIGPMLYIAYGNLNNYQTTPLTAGFPEEGNGTQLRPSTVKKIVAGFITTGEELVVGL